MTIHFEDMMRAWQEQPLPISSRELDEMAKKARRRAAWIRYRDVALFLVGCGLLVRLVVQQPSFQTIGLGIIVIGLMAWPTWRRHKIVSLMSQLGEKSRGTVPSMIRIAKAEQTYRAFAALTAAPMVATAWCIKLSTRVGGDYSRLLEAVALTHPVRVIWVTSVILFVAWWTVREWRKANSELRHLHDLQSQYEAEEAATITYSDEVAR